MKTRILLVNPDTDGAIPLEADISTVHNNLSVSVDGKNGFELLIGINDILSQLEASFEENKQ